MGVAEVDMGSVELEEEYETSDDENGGGSSGGSVALIGAAVGGVALVAVAAAFILYRRRQQQQSSGEQIEFDAEAGVKPSKRRVSVTKYNRGKGNTSFYIPSAGPLGVGGTDLANNKGPESAAKPASKLDFFKRALTPRSMKRQFQFLDDENEGPMEVVGKQSEPKAAGVKNKTHMLVSQSSSMAAEAPPSAVDDSNPAVSPAEVAGE